LSLLEIETEFLGLGTLFKSVPSNQQFQSFFRTTPRALLIERDMFQTLFSITEALPKQSENWTERLGLQLRAKGYTMVEATATNA